MNVSCIWNKSMYALAGPSRSFGTTAVVCNSRVSGKYKVTKYRTRPLTYEMACKPEYIGIRKSWLSWHTHDLEEFRQRLPKIVAEDDIIRKLVLGTWHQLFATELIIKRRGNQVILAGIVLQRLSARQTYWLIGYTEELLSYVLKQPVKMELQTVNNFTEVVFKYI